MNKPGPVSLLQQWLTPTPASPKSDDLTIECASKISIVGFGGGAPAKRAEGAYGFTTNLLPAPRPPTSGK